MRPSLLRSEEFMAYAMDTWADTVYRIALSHAKSVADAEDVTQDVFVKLLKSTLVFESDEHLKAWLISTTLNRCREMRRTTQRRKTSPVAELPDTRTSPPADEKILAKNDAVWNAFGNLPPNMRSAMHLRYVEGYSAEEIATMAQCRPSTVRSWLFRARKKMKSALEGKDAL